MSSAARSTPSGLAAIFTAAHATRLRVTRRQRGIERGSYLRDVFRFTSKPVAETEVLQTGCSVELIEGEWRDETGFAGAQCFSPGAEASMMNDHGSSREHSCVRSRRNNHYVRRRSHHVSRRSDQQTAAAQSSTSACDCR